MLRKSAQARSHCDSHGATYLLPHLVCCSHCIISLKVFKIRAKWKCSTAPWRSAPIVGVWGGGRQEWPLSTSTPCSLVLLTSSPEAGEATAWHKPQLPSCDSWNTMRHSLTQIKSSTLNWTLTDIQWPGAPFWHKVMYSAPKDLSPRAAHSWLPPAWDN
jgi:hypothetical protein